MRVNSVICDDLFDHLVDEKGFSAASVTIAPLESVEAAQGVVGASLLRKEQRETIPICESGPS